MTSQQFWQLVHWRPSYSISVYTDFTDRTFHKIEASKSVDQRFWTTHDLSTDDFFDALKLWNVQSGYPIAAKVCK